MFLRGPTTTSCPVSPDLCRSGLFSMTTFCLLSDPDRSPSLTILRPVSPVNSQGDSDRPRSVLDTTVGVKSSFPCVPSARPVHHLW